MLDEDRGRLLPGAREAAGLARELALLGGSIGRIAAAADAVLDGRLPAFGWTTFETGYPPDWHADPRSGRRWPLAYWAELDFRHEPGLEEPRLVWEINRQHELVTLGRAWALTGDERYARAIWTSMRDWADRNPPFFGINWTSALEVALRLVSWSLAVDLVGTVGATDEDVRTVVTCARLQAEHLSDNLSVYASSRNNHLIGEAAGLIVVAAKFPFLRGAGGWLASGLRHLRREFIRQIAPDGVPREQALHYGAFVAEFALVSAAALRTRGSDLPEDVRERLRRMAGFLSAAASGAGVVPEIGDSDGGRVYELSDLSGRQAIRAAACAALETADWIPAVAEDADLEPSLWLRGPADVRRALDSRRDRRTRESEAFSEGGYFVLAREPAHAVVDCGELGYLSIAAHGHADCLSLVYGVGGRWLIVDPGTCCYHGSRGWRDHFRSTRAHNTVAVDGRNQSEIAGPFMWGARARPSREIWCRTLMGDVFRGSHDGYRGTGVVHTRTVALLPLGACVIVDRLVGRGRHDVESGFQMAAGVEVRRDAAASIDGRTVFGLRGPGGNAMLHLRTPRGLACEVVAGREEPRTGWVSRGFGDRTAAPRVGFRGEVELPVMLVSLLLPGSAFEGGAVRIEGDERSGASVSFVIDGRRQRFLAGSVRLGNLEFEGAFGICLEPESRPGAVSPPLGAVGLDITKWTRDGAAVEYERAANRL